MSPKPRAAILGAGPSSAYALAACEDMGVEVDVYSNRPSFAPNGRVWYHKIPERLKPAVLPEPIMLFGVGTREIYLERQNRPSWAVTTFPVGQPIYQWGYDPGMVRSFLMPQNFPYVKIDKITDEIVADLAKSYRWVFQSFPTDKSKKAQPPLRTYHVLVREHPMENTSWPNVMIFNGTKDHWWTRWSCIFGVTCWEFSSHEYPEEGNMPPPPTGTRYEKSKDFAPNTFWWDPRDVPASNVTLIGRWARWDKVYLTHMAYDEAMAVLKRDL